MAALVALTMPSLAQGQLNASAAAPSSSGTAISSAAAGSYVPVSPARLLDTRTGAGTGVVAPVAAGGTVRLVVDGQGGLPSAGVSAVVLNVTAVQPKQGGFVTVWPDQSPRPGTSNLNFVAGQIVPNQVVAQVGPDGAIELYNGSAGATNLIADVFGYYRAGAPVDPGTFTPVSPARLLDTRTGAGTGVVAPVAAGGTVRLVVDGQGGLPSAGVSAVVLNVTAVQPKQGGFVTVWPDQSPRPGTSNLNFVAGQIVPNQVVAQVGPDGAIELYNGSAGATNLIADAFGYTLSYDWRQIPAKNPVIDPNTMGAGQLNGVSCIAGSTCVEVGNDGSAPIAKSGTGAVSTQTVLPVPDGYGAAALNGVSCPTAGTCFAVGEAYQPPGMLQEEPIVASQSGGSWTETLLPPSPPGAFYPSRLTSVSCWSASNCIAAGFIGAPDTPSPYVEVLSGGSWTPTMLPTTSEGYGNLVSISCPTATFCQAVGTIYSNSYVTGGLIETLSGGAWTASRAPVASGASYVTLNDVSCIDQTTCFAVGAGDTPDVAVETFGTSGWAASLLAPPAGPTSTVGDAVSCVTADECTIVADGYVQSTQQVLPVAYTEMDGSWVAGQLPEDPASSRSYLHGISCTSAITCAVVGRAGDPLLEIR